MSHATTPSRTRATLVRLSFVLAVLLAAVAGAQALMPCGVPPGEQCGTDTQCECMHPELGGI